LLNRLSVTQKGILLVLLPVAFELLFVAVLSANLFQAQSTYATVQSERDTLLLLHKIQAASTRTAMAVFTPHASAESLLPTLTAQLQQIKDTQDELARRPMQSQELKEVCQEFAQQLELMHQIFDKMHAVFSDPSIQLHNRMRHLDPFLMASMVRENRKLINRLDKLEADFQVRGPQRLAAIRKELTLSLIAGIAIGAMLSVLLSRIFARDIISRLRKISEQAQSFFQGKPLALPQDGTDEIAQLDKTFYETAETLRQTRLREQAILDNAADVICSLDSKYRFLGVSAAAEKLWGREPADLLGAPISILINEDSLEETLGALARIVQEGKGGFETRIALKNGSLADFHWSARWSENEKSFFCTVHDVTEIRAVERLKAKFLSIVSHDLRAPITSVGISLNILAEGKRGKIPEKALAVLSRSEVSLSTLTVLVNELLDLDKLEAGKMSLNSSPVSAKSICTGACQSLASLAESAGIKLVVSETDCLLWGDQMRLTQALTNLVSNAIKFSPRNSTVRIEVVPSKEFAELRVIDSGPGIPEADRAYIFDKFRQTSVQSNIGGKSSGLGLTIVKAIAEAHNGSAGIVSAGDAGSTFFMRLPRLTGSLEADDL